MNTAVLTRQYDKLTAQERLALLLAAEARGDRHEFNRLMETAPRKNYSVPHHAPLLDTFLDLSKLHFMQLLDTAACYFDAFEQPGRKRGRGADPLEGWDMVLLLGYLFRTYLEGWRQFCAELNIDPEFMWNSWPGYETIKAAERTSGPHPETGFPGAAYVEEGAVRYYARRALGDREADVDAELLQKFRVVTPESMAADLRTTWEHGLKKWGAAV